METVPKIDFSRWSIRCPFVGQVSVCCGGFYEEHHTLTHRAQYLCRCKTYQIVQGKSNSAGEMLTAFRSDMIQPRATLNFRDTIEEVDTAASDLRNSEIAAMNREARIARQEWVREHQ